MLKGACINFFSFAGTLRVTLLLGDGVGEPAHGIVAAQVAFDEKKIATGAQDFDGIATVIARIQTCEYGVGEFELF